MNLSELATRGAACLFLLAAIPCARAQGTAISHQGRLVDGGVPAQGTYDLQFVLHAAPGGPGSPVAGPIVAPAVPVVRGLFSVLLDFGAGAFDGDERWLETAVRTNGAATFSTLSPRLRVAATAYAIRAASAATADAVAAAHITGTLPLGILPDAVVRRTEANTFGGPVTAPAFIGDGAGVSNVTAIALAAPAASQFWRTTGNAGTSPAANFLGTVDEESLEIRVGGSRALRIAPAMVPNLIGGYYENEATGVRGAAIGGGGTSGSINRVTGDYGFVGAGHGNTAGTMAVVAGGVYQSAFGTFSTIGGGFANTNLATSATLAGGFFNLIGADSQAAAIGGGESNSISPASVGSVVDGGVQNLIGPHAGYSTVAGGQGNTLLLTSWSSIGGGRGNSIWGADEGYCTIAGGEENLIAPSDLLGPMTSVDFGTIGGGHWNQARAPGATVAGGRFNGTLGTDAAIAGGYQNRAWGDGSFIGGGTGNFASGRSATVAGGAGNTAVGAYATVGGGGGDAGQSINQALGDSSTVAGGYGNAATSTGSTIGGGTLNQAGGTNAFVAGGSLNAADGTTSFAAGRRARALHDGSFVWADSQDADFASTTNNQVSIRAGGGVRLSDDTPELSFGGSLRQMVNLWNGKYGIGIQESTMYFRCDNGTGLDGFAWFRGGQHHDGRRRAGGGNWLMSLDDSGLEVNYGTITAFNGMHWSLGGGLVNNQGGSIELGPASGNGEIPFVDFHFGANAPEDFNVRVINDRDRELAFFRSSPDRTSSVEMARLNVLGLWVNGTFVSTSDRHAKAGFEPADPQAILAQVAALPISRWHYTNDPATRHLGPVAQDFHAAFGVGPDDKHIATVDADGVALAAIQGLNAKVEQLGEECRRRAAENARLQEKLARLESLVHALAATR